LNHTRMTSYRYSTSKI